VAAIEITRHAQAQFDPRVTEAFGRIPLARLTEISRLYDARVELVAASVAVAAPLPPAPVGHVADALFAAAVAHGDAPAARC
jgi:hypothetical protein